MMKLIVTLDIVICTCLACLFAEAQENLVPNPSFERFIECPDNWTMITKTSDWRAYRDSPDSFHSCSTNANSVPENAVGYQCPASGNGYAGFTSYIHDAIFPENWREFLGCKLKASMIPGRKYYISFKVSLADDVSRATNNLGALFSTRPYCGDTSNICDTAIAAPLTNYAHFYSELIITDTVKWTTLSGSFVADSAYEYLIIGNFFTDDNTNFVVFDTLTKWSYYYIDDVCVSLDSTTCLNTIDSVIEFDVGTNIIPRDTCLSFSIKTIAEYDAFEWHFEGGVPSISTDSEPDNICYSMPGEFDVSLIASNTNGCSDTLKKTDYISVLNPNHAPDLKNIEVFVNIHPNPSSGVFKVIINKNMTFNIPVAIYDYLGLEVYRTHLKQFHNEIDISNLPSGIYFMDFNVSPKRKKIILSK